jgi:hypothetical protein
MVEIRRLLGGRRPGDPAYVMHAKPLPWGAGVSAYGAAAPDTLARGETPVLIELRNDLGLPPDRIVEIDHHGERAGIDKPTSIEQVFALLGRPRGQWTRRLDLVAANDRGYIPGLLGAGASREEAAAIRAEDRMAQGITPADENAAAQAVERREELAGGALTLVELPHDRFAAVSDRLHRGLGGPGYEALLILGRSEAQYDGPGDVVVRLGAAVAGSWRGGSLPAHGFWGCRYEALGAGDAAGARRLLLPIITPP